MSLVLEVQGDFLQSSALQKHFGKNFHVEHSENKI